MLTAFWILVWTGYIGVDGRQFDSKQACETYALQRVRSFERLPLPSNVHCEEITSLRKQEY